MLYPGVSVTDGDARSYEVLKDVGRGGFGVVFELKRDDGSKWALKTLPTEYGSEQEATALRHEAETAIELDHPNIVKYIYYYDGCGDNNLPPYIIMEYVTGGSLRDLLNKLGLASEQLNADTLKPLMLGIIDGMETINSKLIHRDVHPGNILFQDRIPKITDFGLSKVAAKCTRSSTFKGIGHMCYMAPEGWKRAESTILMDMYSLGIVFYEMAAGHHPLRPEVDSLQGWQEELMSIVV